MAKRRQQGQRWTPARWQADNRRAQAVFLVLTESGRDLTEVQALLSRLRQHYMQAKQAQGYEYHLPATDLLPVGTWKRFPVTTRAERQRKFKKWSDDYLLAGELNPEVEARQKVYRKIPKELADLEKVGAYGRQGRRRKGRPSAGIPAALVKLRALFPRQHGQQPVWEQVATLARLFFAEELPPSFNGTRARDWAATYRHRQRT